MAFALPVWLAVQEELLGHGEADCGAPSTLDEFDDEDLFQTFHLTRPCIAFITDAVRIRLQMIAVSKPELSVDAMVLLALNYYAHGGSSTAVLRRLGLNQADYSVPAVITELSGVFAGMTDQFISFPQTQEDRADVSSKIEQVCGIPNVLGVLVTAHFKIRASPYEKDTFRSFVNTLGYTSVASEMICDSDGNIMSVGKCCVGSTKEQEMWESSLKGREIEEELHGPHWVIGGQGYQLSKHVLTPVSEPTIYNEVRFNEAHTKIHNVMRATLSIMKKRFRCLMQLGFAQEGSLGKQSNIIMACSVLHNIAKKFSVPTWTVAGKIEPLHPGKQQAVPVETNPEAIKARQELINANFSSADEPKSEGTTAEEV